MSVDVEWDLILRDSVVSSRCRSRGLVASIFVYGRVTELASYHRIRCAVAFVVACKFTSQPVVD